MKQQRFSEIKGSVIELTDNLLSRIQDIISLINEENWKISFEKICFLVEDLSTLIEGIEFLNINGMFSIEITEMNEKLSMLLDALEQNDYLHVNDIFSFEIIPLLDFWMESLKNG